MRAVLALAVALLVASGAVAPHAHGGLFGSHACQACLTASGEEAGSATPGAVVPRAVAAHVPASPGLAPVTGAPLGSVPGQSPPLV